MKILNISLQDYRNYDTAALSLGGGVNLFLGDNAQGKTNLLEALYLVSIGRSARTPRDRELIRNGADQARIAVEVCRRVGTDRIQIVISRRENKRIAVNSMPLARMGELMGVCNCVLFSPDEMRVIKEGPGERRRFADIAICQMSKPYFYALGTFNRCLAQRNKLLRSGQAQPDVLDVWDEQLATAGARIAKSRRGFVQRLSTAAARHHSYLTDGAEHLVLEYEGLKGETLDDIKAEYLELLRRSREADLRLGFTQHGVQKDDFLVLASGTDLRGFGSQGQQRTASLSLKLGQMSITHEQTNETPILLLDDVLSELDPNRCAKLLELVRDFQTVITATHIDPNYTALLRQATTFHVKNGRITQ